MPPRPSCHSVFMNSSALHPFEPTNRCVMNSRSESLSVGRCWDQTVDEDDDLLITTVNHTKDLMRMHTLRADPDICQSSADWLKSNGLQSASLALPHFLSCCTASPGNTGEQLDIHTGGLRHTEMKLYQMIELYHNRIRWLTEGSRKVFGVVRGSKVAVLVDTSDVNCSADRLIDLQRNLLDVLDKQLRHKNKLCPIAFGSEVTSLWDKPRGTSPLRLREIREWVLQLGPNGGCNLLQALKTSLAQMEAGELDSLLIILGSCPDHPLGLLCDLVEQELLEREMSVHVVGYCCSSPVAIETVKKLADVSRGSYHLFSASLGVLDDSTDLELLWAEIKAARDVLSHIPNMCSGHMEDSEIQTGMEDISLSEKPPGTDHLNAPLRIQPKGLLPVTSVEWLKTHGLKAQRLSLYQVLAPNAYSPLKEFVPILGKTVTATVHERAMVPFEWHDGTVKNVHVDLPLLLHYQKQLQNAMRELERRLLWLNSTGSRQIWGTVCEPRVQILVDTSSVNDRHWLHILHSLRLLLEEHLANQQSFNVTVFGTEATSWRECLVPVSSKNLQEAWQWLQGRQCAGGRNALGALRQALEGDHHHRASPLAQGLYLFTSGVPDQDMAAVSAYVAERCSTSDVRLHVCLFTADSGSSSDPLPPRYASQADTAHALRQLARAGKGRFHWISDTGIVESDDASALIGEMEKATHYWQKCNHLVVSLAQKASIRAPVTGQARAGSAPLRTAPTGTQQEKLPSPRPTILSLTRLSNRENGPNKDSSQRAITWRPNSAKAVIPPAKPLNGWKPVESDLKRKKIKTTQSYFFLEDGTMGTVFKAYSKPRGIRKVVSSVKLPKREEICSTKQWLKKYGIRSLRLDLHKLVSGPDCVHHKKIVTLTKQKDQTKYCAVLPSVEVNGRVRHIQLSPAELRQYLTEAERLLLRYSHRLQWLLTGSRRVFGTVLERSVCFLLDISGSMAPNLSELKKELASLIWEQLHKQRVRFTLLAFSGDVRLWRPELVEPTEEACRQAEHWLSQLTSHGGTCTLEALQVACGLGAPLACYLVSDGKPDSSCSRLLQEAQRLTAGKDITIHTIAFHCRDRADKEFLKTLAHKTKGRFHCAHEDAEVIETLAPGEQWESKLSEEHELTFPQFEADDLKRLGEEMNKLMLFQKEARGFRDVLLEKKNHKAS